MIARLKTFILVISIMFASSASGNNSENLYLSSGYRIVKDSAFILSPDDLRRVYTIFAEAKKNNETQTEIVFGVIRKDRRFYETTEIEDVLADPNVEGREIVFVKIELRVTDPKILDDPRQDSNVAYIEFDGTPKPRITIRASNKNRNWALALADEVEPQVERVLNKKKTPIWLLVLVIVPIVVLLFRLKWRFEKDTWPRVMLEIFANPSLVGLAIGVTAATYSVWSQNEAFRMFFGPVYGFSWGDYAGVIADWSNTRDNIFWVILIGVPLGIAVNFISSLFESPSDKVLTEEASKVSSKDGEG